MQKTNTQAQEIEVVTIGAPDTDALTQTEQEVFFYTLLNRIRELSSKGGK